MSFTADVAGSGVADFSAGAGAAVDVADPAIGVFLNALQNPDTAGGGAGGTQQEVINLDNLFREFAQGVLWILGQVHGAAVWAQGPAKQIGGDLIKTQGANESSMRHIVGTILPHSLEYLRGNIFSTGIIPLRVRMTKAESNIKFLLGWRGQINTWRKEQVDPTLQAWRQFHSWFNNNAAPAITTLIQWLHDPGVFGKWAARPIAAPLAGYLGAQGSEAVRDTFTLLMVRAWSERPNLVWEAILQWSVTDTK